MVKEVEISEGYQYTEIGLIPKDWEVKTLNEVARYRRGSFPQPYGLDKWYDDTNGLPFVQVFDVDENWKLKSTTKRRISKEAQRMSVFVEKGSIVLTIQGSIGRTAITQYDAYLDRTLLLFESFFVPFNKYFFMLLVYALFEQEKQKAPGGTIKTITKEALSSFKISFPKIAEQNRVAEILFDTEVLIENLEKLIVKKRNIKQGAMQELLTGRKRLAGFEDEWGKSKIGDILKVRHGRSQKDVQSESGIYPILGSGGLMGYANEYLCDSESVLIGRKGTIDKPQFMDCPFWTVDTLFYTEIKKGYSPKFIYYKFLLIDWYSYNEASGVPSLNAKTIENIEMVIPSYETQLHIAQILTDMDDEIEALEEKLFKYKMIKQGMMQVLLTGKIRLK
jgi:type I restriction enzyme S subunit